VAGQQIKNLLQFAHHLFGLHHALAALGQLAFLTLLWRKPVEFIGCMAQVIRIRPGFLDPGLLRRQFRLGLAPSRMQRTDTRRSGSQATKSIQQIAVLAGIGQRPVIVLAMNFDEVLTDGFENLDADGLIIDKGTGAAIRQLHPPQDQIAFGIKTCVLRDGTGGMGRAKIEYRRDLPLRQSLPHKAAITATAERQGESIEQDGFAGAGFTGQHKQSGLDRQVKPVDQDDITNGKPREHKGACGMPEECGEEPGERPEALSALQMPMPRRKPRNARLIQELSLSRGSTPPACRSLYESLYHWLSGKLWPSTAAAVCASGTMPRDI
jgi:hypothetical protein